MTLQIIYLHGFQSSSASQKAQQLRHYLQQGFAAQALNQAIQLYCPDLNQPPRQGLSSLRQYIAQAITQNKVALIGSSLGGFYAHILAAEFDLAAVLINPAMQPWHLFARLFGVAQLPYQVTANWTLDATQLEHLAQMAQIQHANPQKILVLLQTGDEVLDYAEAERYYRQAHQAAVMITQTGGDHAMLNFAEKIPFALRFLGNTFAVEKGK